MGVISVSLPSDGSTIDAADVNNPINTIVTEINGNLDNDNIKAGAAIAASKLAGLNPSNFSNPYKFRVIKTADQTGIANNTWTTVTWNSEDYDTGSNFASNTFTAPVAGFYHFDVSICSTALGGVYLGRPNLRLLKNGSTEIAAAGSDYDNGISYDFVLQNLSDTLQLAANDTIVVQAYFTISGGTCGVGGSSANIITRWSGKLESAT